MTQTQYPIGGYAPGDYQCKCHDCEKEFLGHREASQCEPCAIKDKEFYDALTPEQRERYHRRFGEIVKLFFEGREKDEEIARLRKHIEELSNRYHELYDQAQIWKEESGKQPQKHLNNSMQTDIEIRKSNGFGKGGKMSWFIRPTVGCINRSRKISGFTSKELREKAEKLIKKWYYPKVILYEIEGETIGSNSKENALKEYWRRCELELVGKQFEVKIIGT